MTPCSLYGISQLLVCLCPAAVAGLAEEFLSVFRRHPAEHQLFDLLSDYQLLTEQQVGRLAQLIRRVPAERGASHLAATKQVR